MLQTSFRIPRSVIASRGSRSSPTMSRHARSPRPGAVRGSSPTPYPSPFMPPATLGDTPSRTILERAIEAGGDSDTIGSIAGQVVGAALGSQSIPADLLARLRDQAVIAATAEELARAGGAGLT